LQIAQRKGQVPKHFFLTTEAVNQKGDNLLDFLSRSLYVSHD
jgi:hypothetical protein